MDKTRIFEAAGKFAAKGQLDKAVKEYQRVLEEDPKDVRALQKLAEIQQKAGKNKEAADLLLRVAESYSDQGFFLKSVAVYKQVLKLGSDRVDVNLKLAQIYQQLGLVSDATQQYQLVANHYDKAGNVRESLNALRKMVDLDPDNVESRRKLAELYAREGMVGEAVTEFRRTAAYLKRVNRADEHLKVLDRIGTLLPDDAVVAKELAQAFIARGEAKRALAKLQVCFRQNPRDIETLQMLARAFQDLGQTAKTVSVFRELVAVHGELGQAEQRRHVLEAILQLVPGDPEATELLRQEAGAPAPSVIAPPPPAAAPAPAAAAPAARAGGAIVPPPPPAAAPAPAATSSAAPAAKLSEAEVSRLPVPRPTPAAGPLPAAVAKTLTEVDVYLKYNLLPKAADHLRKALAEAPDFIAVQEKRLVVADRLGQPADAIDALARLIALAHASGDIERESSFLQDLGQRAPTHPLITEAAAAAELDELDLDAAEVVVEPEAEDDIGPLVPNDGGEQDLVDVEFLTSPPHAPPPAPAPTPAPAAAPPPADPFGSDGIEESVSVEDSVAPEEEAEEALALEPDEAFEAPPAVRSSRSDIDPFRLDDTSAPPAIDDEDFGLGPDPSSVARAPQPAVHDDALAAAAAMVGDEVAILEDSVAPGTVPFATDEAPFEAPAVAAPLVEAEPEPEPFVAPEVEDDDEPTVADDVLEVAPPPPPPPSTSRAPSKPPPAPVSSRPPSNPPAISRPPAAAPALPTPPPPAPPAAVSSTRPAPAVSKPPPSLSKPPPAPPSMSRPPPEAPDFTAELEEAEFLLQQDLKDDARFAVEAVLAQAPDHVRAKELLLRIDPPAASAPPREPTMPPNAPPPLAAGGHEGFDLARELADEFDFLPPPPTRAAGGDAGVSVAEMVSAVAGQPDATHEDAQTHYDLGIAYKEMGLLDEAVQEFEVALKATGRRRIIDCLTMIGMCRFEKGDPTGALDAFSRALKTPGITLEASKEAHYEIGRCHETLGDSRKALDHLGRVLKADPAFRDVKARVARLQPLVRAASPGTTVPAKAVAKPAAKSPVDGKAAPKPAAAATAAKAPAKAAPAAAPAKTDDKPASGRGGKIGYV